MSYSNKAQKKQEKYNKGYDQYLWEGNFLLASQQLMKIQEIDHQNKEKIKKIINYAQIKHQEAKFFIQQLKNCPNQQNSKNRDHLQIFISLISQRKFDDAFDSLKNLTKQQKYPYIECLQESKAYHELRKYFLESQSEKDNKNCSNPMFVKYMKNLKDEKMNPKQIVVVDIKKQDSTFLLTKLLQLKIINFKDKCSSMSQKSQKYFEKLQQFFNRISQNLQKIQTVLTNSRQRRQESNKQTIQQRFKQKFQKILNNISNKKYPLNNTGRTNQSLIERINSIIHQTQLKEFINNESNQKRKLNNQFKYVPLNFESKKMDQICQFLIKSIEAMKIAVNNRQFLYTQFIQYKELLQQIKMKLGYQIYNTLQNQQIKMIIFDKIQQSKFYHDLYKELTDFFIKYLSGYNLRQPIIDQQERQLVKSIKECFTNHQEKQKKGQSALKNQKPNLQRLLFQQELQTKNKQIQDLRRLIQQQKQQIKQLKEKYQRQLNKNRGTVQEKCHFFPFFQGSILNEQIQLKQYLTEEIEIFKNKKIKRAQFLYKYDEFNESNFHNYIDGHEDIVLLIETSNEQIIGGYSERGFKNLASPLKNNGFICSLTKKKIFRSKSDKCIIDDDFYVIFGQSQLKILTWDTTLYSNFGKDNVEFGNDGFTFKEMFQCDQTSKREVRMNKFEFYRVIFQQGN